MKINITKHLILVSIFFILNIALGCCSFDNPEDTKGKASPNLKSDNTSHNGTPKRNQTKKLHQKDEHKFESHEIELKKGKGSANTGGAKGGYFWHIFAQGNRTGKVFINLINEEPIGIHPSIQLYLNKKYQGRHIGRHAYHQACTQSHYDQVYAHIRKSNIPSIRAAEKAGFTLYGYNRSRQPILRWVRLFR